MKIVTWNVNSLKVRLEQLIAWLTINQPDIVALQEIKCTIENFPAKLFAEYGYQSVAAGQKTYNGVALLAKQTITRIQTDIANLDDAQRRILAVTINGIRIINLYVPNGESITSDKYQYKLNWLSKVGSYLKTQLDEYKKVIVLGDFNIAPEDRDVHDPAAWAGQVLFSEPERTVFQQWLQLGLHDSFRLFPQPEKLFSWWDYRQLALQKNKGLRIDHILISQDLVPLASSCVIDKAVRKSERPSDHAPVVLSLS